jgi:hypothetical protein
VIHRQLDFRGLGADQPLAPDHLYLENGPQVDLGAIRKQLGKRCKARIGHGTLD